MKKEQVAGCVAASLSVSVEGLKWMTHDILDAWTSRPLHHPLKAEQGKSYPEARRPFRDHHGSSVETRGEAKSASKPDLQIQLSFSSVLKTRQGFKLNARRIVNLIMVCGQEH